MAKLSRLAALSACILLIACTAHEPPNTSPDYNIAPMDLSTPEGTAHAMMMAMYRGDAGMVDAVFMEGAALRRIKADGSVQPDGLKRWRNWVGTLEPGQAHEEIFGLKVNQFENLATIWAPFVITFNGEIAGCGVNQLSMARNEGEWRVVSAMDTPAPKESCATFKESYLSGNG